MIRERIRTLYEVIQRLLIASATAYSPSILADIIAGYGFPIDLGKHSLIGTFVSM